MLAYLTDREIMQIHYVNVGGKSVTICKVWYWDAYRSKEWNGTKKIPDVSVGYFVLLD